MTGIKCCISKDIKEVLRTGKLILFLSLSVGLAVLILLFTLLFTDIPDALAMELPGFDIQSLEDMMKTLYPRMVRESLGVFSYYIGFFYSLVTILVCHNILPKERKNGKWILPLEQGYTYKDFLIGKCTVYGILAWVSVFVSYIFYYIFANTFMMQNMKLGDAVALACIHGLNAFFILDLTILMSVWFKSGVPGAISMIATVLFVPDIMNFLPIGKYFPTYMLTFVYNSETAYSDILFPLFLNIVCLIVTYIISVSILEKNK